MNKSRMLLWMLHVLLFSISSHASDTPRQIFSEMSEACAKAHIEYKNISHTGKLDKEASIRVLQNSVKSLVSCLCPPSITESKSFVVNIGINLSGQVDKFNLLESNATETEIECLRSRIIKWKFPEAQEPNTSVKIPIIFIPQKPVLKGKKIALREE